jgi:hypothetical protein
MKLRIERFFKSDLDRGTSALGIEGLSILHLLRIGMRSQSPKVVMKRWNALDKESLIWFCWISNWRP